MNGGNYTVYVTTAGGVPCTDVRVAGNRLGRDYCHGPRVFASATNVWADNVWDDNGQPVP